MLSDIIQLSLYAVGCAVSHFWGRSIGYRNGGQDAAVGCAVSHFWGRSIGYRNGGQDTMDFHYEEGYNRGANDATNAIKGSQNKENL